MKIQRAVIQSGRKTKSIVYQYQFTTAVATIHTAYLWYGLVTLIYHHQVIFGKIIQQAEWPCAWSSSVKKTGVVLNSIAITQLADHFNVIVYSFSYSLRFNIFPLRFKIFYLGIHFILYLINHLLQIILRSHIKIGREDRCILHYTDPLAAYHID